MQCGFSVRKRGGEDGASHKEKEDALLEEVCELLLRDRLGQVLQEENLVRRQILVGHLNVRPLRSSSGSTIRYFTVSTAYRARNKMMYPL